MNDYQKLSSDLSRVTEFLISNNLKMASKFSDRIINLYSNLPGKIGSQNLTIYLRQIANLDGGKMKAAERAMTASIILSKHLDT